MRAEEVDVAEGLGDGVVFAVGGICVVGLFDEGAELCDESVGVEVAVCVEDDGAALLPAVVSRKDGEGGEVVEQMCRACSSMQRRQLQHWRGFEGMRTSLVTGLEELVQWCAAEVRL